MEPIGPWPPVGAWLWRRPCGFGVLRTTHHTQHAAALRHAAIVQLAGARAAPLFCLRFFFAAARRSK